MNSWILTGNLAKWQNESIVLAFDQSKPGDGINVLHPATQSSFRLFGLMSPTSPGTLEPPEAITPCGSTLRASFPESDSLSVETHLAWSVLDLETAIVGIDLVVTIGTQKLDAQPQVNLCSQVGNADTLVPENVENRRPSEGPSCTLFRLGETDLSYCEMLHPAEFHSTEASQDLETGGAILRHHLFSCPLEKGVILRARLRGLLLVRGGDEAAAAASFEEFLAAPLPLGR
jgi:hypothetical protein